MGTVKFPDDLAKFQKAKFFASKGIVTESRIWSSTHVYGGGGGTAEGMQVKVRSNVHEHREFHLKDGDYNEIISLVDANFPVASGNLVSIVCIKDVHGRNHYVEGINHSTGMRAAFNRNFQVAGGAGSGLAVLFWLGMIVVGFFMQGAWFVLSTVPERTSLAQGTGAVFNPGALIVALLGLALMFVGWRNASRGSRKILGQDANIEGRIDELLAYLDQVPVAKAAAE